MNCGRQNVHRMVQCDMDAHMRYGYLGLGFIGSRDSDFFFFFGGGLGCRKHHMTRRDGDLKHHLTLLQILPSLHPKP